MSANTDRSHTIAMLTALLVTVLWSSSWVLIRVGLDDEDLAPLTFAGLRYSLAAVVVLTVVATRPGARAELGGVARSRSWVPLVVLGVVFYAVTQGAQFVAIDSQPAATSSLLLTPTPLLVAVIGQYAIGEAVRRTQVIGAALMIAGAMLFFSGDLAATAIGVIASIVGLAANVSSSLLGRSINRRQHLSPIVVTAVSMTIGAVLLLGAGLITEGIPRLSTTAIVVIVWLAVINTALAFTLWNTSLRRLAAVESAAINNTMLIQIAVLAWIFLDESPGIVGVIGIAIVSIGAAFAQGIDVRMLAPTRRRRSA